MILAPLLQKLVSMHQFSKETLQILQAAPPMLILNPNPPDFEIIFANDSFYQATHTTPEDLPGSKLFTAFPQNPRESEVNFADDLQSSLLKCLESKRKSLLPAQRYDIPVRGSDEFETRYWEASNTPVLNEQGEVEYIVHCVVDITSAFILAKKERINQEVTESKREELYSLFMQAPAGIVVFSGENLIYEMVNPSYQSFFPGRELLGKPLLTAVPELNGHPLVEGLRNTFFTGNTYFATEQYTELIRTQGGAKEPSYWNYVGMPRYNNENQIDGVTIFGYEVTDFVKSRKKIEENEARFRTILETMVEGVGVTDATGNMIFANQMAEEILGLQRDEILSRTYHDQGWRNLREDGTPLPKEEHPVSIALTTGHKILGHEIGVDVPGRGVLHLSINAAPIRNEENCIIGAIGTFTDVTEKKKTLQLKDEFVSTVSHELKTPLTSIKAYLQILQRTLVLSEHTNSRAHFERLCIQVFKLEKLVRDLLDVTKITSRRLKLAGDIVDMQLLVTDHVADLQIISPAHKLIITQNDPLKVKGDKERIGQVVNNLITNAIKYSPEADRVLISLTGEGNYMRFTVEDFGLGVPKDQRSEIFKRFHQATNHNAQAGLSLGLGLYISKEIISQAGGEIGLEPKEQGSKFFFTLPRIQ